MDKNNRNQIGKIIFPNKKINKGNFSDNNKLSNNLEINIFNILKKTQIICIEFLI